MKLILLSVLALSAAAATAAPVTLVSVLADRPVFSYVTGGLTQTRALSPGNRIKLDPGVFSGLGVKKLPLREDGVYYLARFGGGPGLWILGSDQVLILNQSGQVIALSLEGKTSASAPLFSGNFALGTASAGGLSVSWDDGTGALQTKNLEGGRVYRLLLESPDTGQGVAVSLTPWD